jgi:N-hydroxyarylamine O-acetyltransferase
MDKRIEAYLKRLNYSGPTTADTETLRRLQLAHLRAVPFENLSIHNNQLIVLNDDSLFTKIVSKRRGGFCYEVNGLFAFLLRSLGFEVEMLAAGVATDNGDFGPEFDHMTLRVNLEEPWLVDVGFGDSFTEPLRLNTTVEQIQGSNSFRVVPDGSRFLMMRKVGDGEWKPQYRFSMQPHVYADYEEMCLYHQTSPESHFTKKRLCSLATADGRITLSEMRLITTSHVQQVRQEQTLGSDEEYASTLRKRFGIVI